MTTSLVVTTVELPTAPLGPCSPLPMLDPLSSIGDIADDVPADVAERARAGAPPSLLPYLAQDDYDRRLVARPHRVAVLENDVLRATVALDLGGRLLVALRPPRRPPAALRQPGRAAGQPRPAQRLVLRRRRVEHRHAGPLTDDDGHAPRRCRRGTGWRTAPATVGVGADPRRRLPSRPVAAVVVAGPLGTHPDPQRQRRRDADVLVDERGDRQYRGHSCHRPGTARLSDGVPERTARRRSARRRRW